MYYTELCKYNYTAIVSNYEPLLYMTLVSPTKLKRVLCSSLYYDRCLDGVCDVMSLLNEGDISKQKTTIKIANFFMCFML